MKPFLGIISFAFFVLPSIAQDGSDEATIRCYYRFSQKKDKSDKEFFSQDTLTLDIGSQMSCYYDESKMQKDSVFQSALASLKPDRIESLSILSSAESNVFDRSLGDTYRSNAYEQIYKNRRNGEIIMINTTSRGASFFDRYKGTDPIGALNWTIEPDTAVFFDYPCQKASLRFRGRDYEAWFSSQIPINDGPWKFFGLPGLILKVKDSEGQFDFECIGLEYLNTPYPIKIPEYKYFETNRKDYNKVMSSQGGGTMININGGKIIIANIKTGTSVPLIELE